MQRECSLAITDIADVGQSAEVIIHTFHHHHRLTVAIHCQCLVFHRFRYHCHLVHLLYLHQHWVVGSTCLAFHWHHLQLWVKRCEEGCHQVAETVKHTHHHHHCHCGNHHPYDTNA